MRAHLLTIAGLASAILLAAAPASAAFIQTTAKTELYGGPGYDYPVLATYKANVRFEIVWCRTHEGWCLVERNAGKGWMQVDAPVAQASGGQGGEQGGALPAAGGTGGGTTTVDRSAPGSGRPGFVRADPDSGIPSPLGHKY